MNELTPSLQLIIAATNTAIAGASHCHAGTRAGAESSTPAMDSAELASPTPNIRALRAADGGRGVQERNCFSSRLTSFITFPLQTRFDLLQAVAIPAGRGVG